MFAYQAFGLRIDSEVELPELIPWRQDSLHIEDEGQQAADLVIRLNDEAASGFKGRPFQFVFGERLVRISIPEVGVCSMEDGRLLQIAPEPMNHADSALLRMYILGTCMGSLLLQRGILPLHGSVLEQDGRAFAIVGESGAGKSTLAAELTRLGCRMLTDDVIPITWGITGEPCVQSTYPRQKLWQQTLDKLGRSNDQLQSIYGREQKFTVPVEASFHEGSLPLVGIIELIAENTSSDYTSAQIELEEVSLLERLQLLRQHTFRNSLLEPMKLSRWHFQQTVSLAEHVPIYRLRRGDQPYTADLLAEQLLLWMKGEVSNEQSTRAGFRVSGAG